MLVDVGRHGAIFLHRSPAGQGASRPLEPRGPRIALVKGPPITVRCNCGETRQVPYPETWQCERCGRRWNTSQIPADEYGAILREMRGFRLSAIVAALALAVVFVALALVVSQALFLLLPVVLAGWYIWYMPLWRRRVRRRARSLPKWQLHPE
jgi:hypothetical protein